MPDMEDLSKEMPEKLEKMKQIFLMEAQANKVPTSRLPDFTFRVTVMFYFLAFLEGLLRIMFLFFVGFLSKSKFTLVFSVGGFSVWGP